MFNDLNTDIIRKNITDPDITSWAIRQLWQKERENAPDKEAMETLFDGDTLRTIINTAEPFAFMDLFRLLPHESFQEVKDLLFERWPEWRTLPAAYAAPVIARLDPEKAFALFEAYFDAPDLEKDPVKTSGMTGTLFDRNDQKGAELARRIIPELTEDDPENTMESQKLQAICLAWTYDRDTFEQLLADYMLQMDDSNESISFVRDVYSLLADELPFLQMVLNVWNDSSEQTFTALAPFFDDEAPLEELDHIFLEAENVEPLGMFNALQRLCGTREQPYIRHIISAFENRREALEKLEQEEAAAFFAAIAAAGWLSSEYRCDAFSLETCVDALNVDLGWLPWYDAVLERLKTFPAAEAAAHIHSLLPEAQEHYGGRHLIKAAGDLLYPGSVPVIIEYLNENACDFIQEAAGCALMRFGQTAEKELLERWPDLDEYQQINAYNVLEQIGSESAIIHLADNLPEEDEVLLECWCMAAQSLPDPRLREALEPFLQQEDPLIDETFYILSILLETDDSRLPAIRERIKAEQKRDDPEFDFFPGNENTIPETLNLELKCRKCGSAGFYEVRKVYFELFQENSQPFISDELTCRKCGAFDAFDIMSRGYLRIMAEIYRISQTGDYEDSPVIPLKSTTLSDGRSLSIAESIAHYKAALTKKPDSLTDMLSLGNCYDNTGRQRRAEECYRECLRIDPACAEAAYGLAMILEDTAREKEAFNVLNKALKHKKKWRFYRLTGTTSREFIDAFHEFHADLVPMEGAPPPERLDMFSSDTGRLTAAPSGKMQPNMPCFCGSGKKYKKCCGRIA
jgi:tetratricopeptide (TPR) repeat protein